MMFPGSPSPRRFEWQLSPDSEQRLREALALIAPALRGELWWWMRQRGRSEFPPWPENPAALDPGPDVIVDAICEDADPAYRKANWALAMYVVLTKLDSPDEWLLGSENESSPAIGEALKDMRPHADWQTTLVGGAVQAIGISGRIGS